MASISFPDNLFDDLSRHLGGTPESIAFMRSPDPRPNGIFRIEDLYLIESTWTNIGDDGHCELDDDIRSSVIKWAWDAQSCLVEAHSHGLLFKPSFSRFDLAQLKEWVPHVRWRLGGRPYAALVTASLQIDGIAWCGPTAEAVDEILIDGRESIQTSGRSLPLLESRRGE